MNNQNQVQKPIATQAIAQTNTNPPNPNPDFVNDPTFWIIIALAFLLRVILGNYTSQAANKKNCCKSLPRG